MATKAVPELSLFPALNHNSESRFERAMKIILLDELEKRHNEMYLTLIARSSRVKIVLSRSTNAEWVEAPE